MYYRYLDNKLQNFAIYWDETTLHSIALKILNRLN